MWLQDDSRAATRRKQGVTSRRYRIDFEKMAAPELVKKSRHFMKPQILIPYPQHPPAVPILSQMNPVHTSPLFQINFNIILPPTQ
jgi:hypothetical protein